VLADSRMDEGSRRLKRSPSHGDGIINGRAMQ
jgi:hypothetical protein